MRHRAGMDSMPHNQPPAAVDGPSWPKPCIKLSDRACQVMQQSTLWHSRCRLHNLTPHSSRPHRPALTHGACLNTQLPDELLIGLRIDVAHIARRLLVAVLGVHADEVGARAGGDAAARDGHAAWRSAVSLLMSADSGWERLASAGAALGCCSSVWAVMGPAAAGAFICKIGESCVS